MTIEDIKKAKAQYDQVHNEGGEGYNPYDTMLDDAVVKATEWSREITIANRATWNNAVAKLSAPVSFAQVRELENKLGFGLAYLKTQIAKYSL